LYSVHNDVLQIRTDHTDLLGEQVEFVKAVNITFAVSILDGTLIELFNKNGERSRAIFRHVQEIYFDIFEFCTKCTFEEFGGLAE
jgi:hypothetical protein